MPGTLALEHGRAARGPPRLLGAERRRAHALGPVHAAPVGREHLDEAVLRVGEPAAADLGEVAVPDRRMSAATSSERRASPWSIVSVRSARWRR